MKHPIVYYAIDAAVIAICVTVCVACLRVCGWIIFKSKK